MFSAIILAAGSSTRMEGTNKQLAKIADVPVFVMSALNFDKSEQVSEIIIAAPEEDISRYEKLARNFGVTKLKAVVAGGATRFLSVSNALAQVSKECTHIAIHDGARPLIPTTEIDRVLTDAVKYDAAIAAAPATDTVKTISSNGFVENSPPREKLYYAQTPQAFSKKLYTECIQKLGTKAEALTDDSALIEQCGGYVRITEMTCCNMKITRPDDLAAANAVYLSRKAVKRI
ncbi:MAG: 2-C-methyl-D-erythritol 4-phosphate cytidylyltransferase [Ruminococcaceae bacterium]|nr:2-C-methyl-D-erythritol 4-phosphate cytidylyltransferase [Oscillospiraceae bacterium]